MAITRSSFEPLFTIKRMLSCGALYTADFLFKKGVLKTRFLLLNPLRIVQLVEIRLMVYIVDLVLLTCNSGDKNSFTHDSKSNSVNDSHNVFNPPPQPSMYSCKFCGNDARYGHYCTPQVPFIYLEPCYNQDFNFPEEERRIAEDQVAKDRYWKIPICYDDDEDYTIAITPVSSTKELDTSLNTCDVPIYEDPSTFDALSNHSEILSDSNNDGTSSDDDSYENIEYVEASPLNLEYVSLEEVNDVDQEEKEFDLEDIFRIQSVILREKLLNIRRLVTNIESLKDNPTPDYVFKSPSSFPIPIVDNDSFFEESDTSFSHLDNSLPEFKGL
ncbi:hypothetical protein Tco_0747861 [Tanacetum coccineum]|uniref:Uncharacterized protein n=1 Tax=Tanacetum coccineum TaxID=301880 RepID=A0ABQ4YUW6_9ASTR